MSWIIDFNKISYFYEQDKRIFYVSRIRYQNILFRRSKEARNSQYKKNNNSYFRLWVDLDKKNPSSFRA